MQGNQRAPGDDSNRTKSAKPSGPGKQISFRLDGAQLSVLEERAKLAGHSPGMLARMLVTQALGGPPPLVQPSPVMDLGVIKAMVAQVRRELLTTFMILLVDGGKAEDPAEAREFVLAQFGRDCLDGATGQDAIAGHGANGDSEASASVQLGAR